MRLIQTGLLAGVLCLCGCIPYVVPSLDVSRRLDLAEVADEVHVFRVDISSKSGAPCYGEEAYALSQVPLIAGVVPAQVQAGLDRGIIIIGVALNYHFHYHNGVHVRLYRPGYDLVQFKSWQLSKGVDWIPVKDFAGREKAVDDLLSSCGTVAWCQFTGKSDENAPWQLPCGLRAGSHSAEHRAALAFAAQEYENLLRSDDPACGEQVKARLLDKVKKVRALMSR